MRSLSVLLGAYILAAIAAVEVGCGGGSIASGLDPVPLPSEARLPLPSPSPTASIAPLTIDSGQPPKGVVGQPYGQSHSLPLCVRYHGNMCLTWHGFELLAHGGTGKYTWSLTSGIGSSLPPGLQLSSPYGISYWEWNGARILPAFFLVPEQIKGTPSVAGTYNVVVSVTDSVSTQHATYTITIAP